MTNYIEERTLPEYLINVPEVTSVDQYTGNLGRLALALSPYRGFPTYQYDIGAVQRDVLLNQEDIGVLNLEYSYETKQVGIRSIRLDVPYVGKNLGFALYRTVLSLPLPSGENPRDYGFFLESRGQSEDARRVWMRLVSTGEATQIGKTHFQMR